MGRSGRAVNDSGVRGTHRTIVGFSDSEMTSESKTTTPSVEARCVRLNGKAETPVEVARLSRCSRCRAVTARF